ncbi:MAG: (Fe-S)-binding protein [Rectinemataceae bacterium]
MLGSGLKRRVPGSQAEIDYSDILPGHDCGMCGSQDCRTFAKELADGRGDPGRCIPGAETVEAGIRLYGREAGEMTFYAVVRCQGSKTVATEYYSYSGAKDCSAAHRLYSGSKDCMAACLGLGTCIPACPLGAIRVFNGLAGIDPRKCSGCGLCISSCPTGSIALVPVSSPWYIACASTASPAEKEVHCSAPCTACAACVVPGAASPYLVEGNLAQRVASVELAATAMKAQADLCPTRAIRCQGG